MPWRINEIKNIEQQSILYDLSCFSNSKSSSPDRAGIRPPREDTDQFD